MTYLDWRFLPVLHVPDVTAAYRGIYDPRLVAMSVVIAVLAAYVALSISGRMVAAATRRSRWAWASAGAISMGGGIWAMHFIGMLAFTLPCGVDYDPFGTLLSAIPGMLASGVALSVISRKTEPGFNRLVVGAVLMGAGIGMMHYSGMAAMQPAALLAYDPWVVALSIVVAVVLAFVSLGIRFRFHRPGAAGIAPTLAAATVMGCAVAGMHYTAMQASIFLPWPQAYPQGLAIPPTVLALLITVFTVLIAAGTLVATFAGRQNELREEAEHANRAKSQFLATVSHEIRTPLNGVLGMANLLAATALNERQARLVDNVMRSGQALLGIITDILDFSKIEAGRFELFEVVFDPHELVAEVADLFSERCASKRLELVYFVADQVPSRVRGDPMRLRQILINLVGNAVKFTERGEILVEAGLAAGGGDHVLLSFSVSDTGIGIAPEKQPLVFNAFEQVDSSMTRAHGGTGLGLAIARRLAAMMGGTMGLESEPGRGSRFHFTARFGLTAAAVPDERHLERRLSVLMVDANAISAQVFARYLERWKIDAAMAATAAEALAAAAQRERAGRSFDVAIIDVKGLGAAGLELAQAIRARRIETVLLLGMDRSIADEGLDDIGALAILTKPVRPSELFDCLASLAAGLPGAAIVPFARRRGEGAPRTQFTARILVVEDNPVNQDVAGGILESMGCQIATAANGKAAVERFAEERFDAVLMDCEMPVMDGFEATARIREIERHAAPVAGAPAPRIPIIALTAHALGDVHVRCTEAGMDDFLVKPFDEQQMRDALRRWIGRSERTHGAPAAAIEPGTIDRLQGLGGTGNAALIARVVAKFNEIGPALAAAMRAKCADNDAEALWQAAHSLKSSAAALGANPLARRCAEIEAVARERGIEPVKPLIDALDGELAAALESLNAMVHASDEPVRAAR